MKTLFFIFAFLFATQSFAADNRACTEKITAMLAPYRLRMKASELPLIVYGTHDWDQAVRIIQISNQKGVNFHVPNQKIAKMLIEERLPEINLHYKPYYRDRMRKTGGVVPDKGWEYHLNDETKIDPESGSGGIDEHDCRHIKYYDRKNGAEGHIFFDEWVLEPKLIPKRSNYAQSKSVSGL